MPLDLTDFGFLCLDSTNNFIRVICNGLWILLSLLILVKLAIQKYECLDFPAVTEVGTCKYKDFPRVRDSGDFLFSGFYGSEKSSSADQLHPPVIIRPGSLAGWSFTDP